MKLSKNEKMAIAAAETLLMNCGLIAETDYALNVSEEHRRNVLLRRTISVTMPFEKAPVEDLINQGWKVAKKYYNHGSPSVFCSDIHNDESELQELTRHHGKRVQMVRLAFQAELPESKDSLEVNQGNRWSPAEDERLNQEFHAGQDWDEIAKSHKRTRAGIRNRLVKLGLVEKG